MSCRGHRPSRNVFINDEVFTGDHSPEAMLRLCAMLSETLLKGAFHAFPQDFRAATTLLLPFLRFAASPMWPVISLLARKRIRFQVMRTSWRKRKKTITPLLPATYHNNAQPFNHWGNVNTMAIPDYFLGMYFIRSRSPVVAPSFEYDNVQAAPRCNGHS